MSKHEAFNVPWFTHALSTVVFRFPQFWIGMGNLETTVLSDQLESVAIENPVFISGLARSGSTILLEAVAAHEQVVTHRYSDFPGVFTPYMWDRGRAKSARPSKPRERSHGDGLMVTPESPEAMEEILWMAFFRQVHDSSISNVLDVDTESLRFEKFFVDHIRKLLLARGGSRYASKENYNVSRLSYLQKIFPTARFVVPVRNPVTHVASLLKQHRLFCEAERRYPRALSHMQRVGHFEFGLDLRPINFGCDNTVQEIQSLWESGEEVRGWARYWASTYGFLYDQLERDEKLRESVSIVRYEELCDRPENTLLEIMRHCEFENDTVVRNFAEKIHAPTYYQPDFSDVELEQVAEETAFVAERFGYEPVFSHV
jgi:hypothetical protein